MSGCPFFPAQQDIVMTQAATRSTKPAEHIPPVPAPEIPPSTRRDNENHMPPAPLAQSAMQDAAYARNWWRVVFDGERTPGYELETREAAIDPRRMHRDRTGRHGHVEANRTWPDIDRPGRIRR